MFRGGGSVISVGAFGVKIGLVRVLIFDESDHFHNACFFGAASGAFGSGCMLMGLAGFGFVCL